MFKSIRKLLTPIFISLLMVMLVFVAVEVEAEENDTGIEVNGLFWGDGDYLDYQFYSESEPDGRGYVYIKNAGPNLLYALVRVGWTANDNAFSSSKPSQSLYLASIDWKNPHDLGRLIGSDHLAMFMECETAVTVARWHWVQDLLYDADEGLGYDWRSDYYGPDGAPVSSATGDDIPPSGIVITSHSSLEYNLENSSWILNQQSLNPTNYGLWSSPDLEPLGTISTTDPMTDVNAITGTHEDYPFFLSTGADPGDLYEWELSYEMLLDVSHCGGGSLRIGVSSAHNSPPKDGTEDILVPTAIRLSEYSAAGSSGLPLATVLVPTLLGIITVGTLVRRRLKSAAQLS